MLVADEIFECALSYGQAVRKLKQLDFEAVAYHLAMLCQFTESAFDAVPLRDKSQVPDLRKLLGLMFHGEAFERITTHIAGLSARFIPLSTQALIATLELSGRFSPRSHKNLHLNADERLMVSHVILSLQGEALSSRLKTEIKEVKDWARMPLHAIEQMVRNMIAANLNRPYASSLSRLYAYSRKQCISELFLHRIGKPIHQWFTDNLGMSADDYLSAAFLAGAIATRFSTGAPNPNQLIFDPAEFFASLPDDARARLDVLISVASIDGFSQWAEHESTTLAELFYEANQGHVTPIVRFGNRHVLISSMLLWNLFACGLPHASLAAVRKRQGEPLKKRQVQGVRGEFGCMFEGYVQWLFHEWFDDKPVRLLTNYSVKVGDNWAERDVAVIADDVAFIFEVKANVVDLDLRKTGSFGGLSRFVSGPVKQAYSAAVAFRKGDVRAADGSPVSAVARAIPVALVYDPVPLNLYCGDHFELWLERLLRQPAFTSEDGRERVILLNIENLESAESGLRMDRDPEQLLAALLLRSNQPAYRYERLNALRSLPRGPKRPAPLSCLAVDTDQQLGRLSKEYLSPDE